MVINSEDIELFTVYLESCDLYLMAFFKRKLTTLLENVATMLANLSFLAIWLLAQYGIFLISASYGTDDEINQKTIIIIRFLFAIGTVIPIIINMYRDVSVMIINANKEIEDAKL